MNEKMVQFHGPFESGKDLLNGQFATKVGISSRQGVQCSINGQIFEIGITGILELDEVSISSICFLNSDNTNTTVVDCILE